jgi:hypothetical protein
LSVSRQKFRWRRSAAGELKLNTDGAFDESHKDGGWGFVIRDSQGRVICSGAGREDYLLNALHAELKGCQAGLQAAIRLGITRLNLEVDASLVKDAIKTDDYRLASIGGIVTEIKHIISDEFPTCLVSVCKRECNKVAHSLAALGCNLPSGCYNTWEGVPSMLEDLVTSDFAGSDE